MYRPLATTDQFDWIEIETAKAAPYTVARCIPSIYPAYVKIFHSIYEDMSIAGDDLTWNDVAHVPPDGPYAAMEVHGDAKSPAEVVERALQNSTLVYDTSRSEPHLTRLRWSELAQRYGTALPLDAGSDFFTRRFAKGSWPRRFFGPKEGSLEVYERDALLAALQRHSSGRRHFFQFFICAMKDMRGDNLFEGNLADVHQFPGSETRYTPTYWFPEDRSWVVCSDYDLSFTLVGGSEALLEDIFRKTELECVRVVAQTALHYD